MLNQVILLSISNAATNFKITKTNLIYLNIIIVKNNQIPNDFPSKAFIIKHGFYLNCYKLIKTAILQI